MKIELQKKLNQLIKIKHQNRLMFTASCCERLLPNYQSFSKIESWGDFTLMQDALNFIWRAILVPPQESEIIINLIEKCQTNSPDTEVFNSIHTSSALDVVTAITESLLFIIDDNNEHIFTISQTAIDTVDMFIQMRDNLDFNNGMNFENKIYNDELMVKEINKQIQDIQFLIENPDISEGVLSTFRGQSNPWSLYSNIRAM